jgi:hypothetical protein
LRAIEAATRKSRIALSEPISTLQQLIAEQVDLTWDSLALKLRFESTKSERPWHNKRDTALARLGLSPQLYEWLVAFKGVRNSVCHDDSTISAHLAALETAVKANFEVLIRALQAQGYYEEVRLA